MALALSNTSVLKYNGTVIFFSWKNYFIDEFIWIQKNLLWFVTYCKSAFNLCDSLVIIFNSLKRIIFFFWWKMVEIENVTCRLHYREVY